MPGSHHSPPPTKRSGARSALVVGFLCVLVLAIGGALIAVPVSAAVVVLVAVAVVAIALAWVLRRLGVVERAASQQPAPGAAASYGPIIVGLVAIVASFSAALMFSQFRIAGTEARAKDILSNTIPSITQLSVARTALRELGTLVDGFLLEPSRATTLRSELAAAHARLDASLAAYEALPSIPEDLEHVAAIARDIAFTDEAIERVVAGTGELPAGRLARRDELHARLARADEAVRELILANNKFAETSAEAVIENRRASAVAAGVFGVISIAVAGLAGWLAIGRMRARARLIDERDRLLAARATELEVFAGRVAHDLRSPLGAVALRAAALQQRHQRDPQLRDDLGKLIRQAERMAEIIDDLLAFASAGARPQPDSSAELHTVVDEVVADFRPAVEAMRAELRVAVVPTMQVACTPAALTCVLSNLVGNAVKYLEDGRHAVAWIAIRVLDREGVARIEVEDTGPGLPPDSEQRVFEPFQRLSGSRPGIGLGLATVKKIVEAYGGRVGVDSLLGKGSTFWFELPIALSPPPSALLPRRDGDPSGSR